MIQVLPALPATARGNVCSICGSADRPIAGTHNHERVVDTGVFIEFEGEFVICESCWVEGAAKLGMVKADRHAQALANFQQAVLERDAARAEIREKDDQIRALRALLGSNVV